MSNWTQEDEARYQFLENGTFVTNTEAHLYELPYLIKRRMLHFEALAKGREIAADAFAHRIDEQRAEIEGLRSVNQQLVDALGECFELLEEFQSPHEKLGLCIEQALREADAALAAARGVKLREPDAINDERLRSVNQQLLEVLKKAVNLYEHFDLRADSLECGTWANSARAAIAAARKQDNTQVKNT